MMDSKRRRLPIPLRVCAFVVALASIGAVAGCGEKPTQLRFKVERAADAFPEATQLAVHVRGPDGMADMRTVDLSEHPFPFDIPVVPLDGDATRSVFFEARLLDESGAVLATLPVESSFRANETAYVAVRFEERCRDVACGHATRCHAGECVDRCVVPSTDSDGDGTPCTTMLDAGAMDAGMDAPSDAGTDAFDAGPQCAVGTEANEDFEARDDWPRCPDFVSGEDPAACEWTDQGERTVLSDAPAPSPCGGGALRLSGREDQVVPAALFAVPSEGAGRRWVRAMMYIPQTSVDALMAAGRNLAILSWSAGRQVLEPPSAAALHMSSGGAFQRWSQDESGSGQDTEGFTGAVPADRWFCLESMIDRDTATVQFGIDGDLQAPWVPDPQTLADPFGDEVVYVRIGPHGSPGVVAEMFVDAVAVSTERIPCPER